MNEIINSYLNRRTEELMLNKMPRNKNLMDEIFAFDPNNLESILSQTLSKYAIGLAQFLVYFTSQVNQARVRLMQKERYIETYINKSNINAKTKADKRRLVIEASPELQAIALDVEALEAELALTENLEKYYIEIINAIKRELTRREMEHRFVRDERRL